MRLVLASASPRRAELLAAAGWTFEIMPAEVDERPRASEDPRLYVARLAHDKAAAVACRISGAAVIGADTAVVVEGRIFGKPADEAEAAEMLRALSGRSHRVVTGVALHAGGRRVERLESTGVSFATLTEEEIAWYVATGEPRDKAGAYAVQGLGSRFIERIEGSYSNVVGLPIACVYQLFKQLGVV